MRNKLILLTLSQRVEIASVEVIENNRRFKVTLCSKIDINKVPKTIIVAGNTDFVLVREEETLDKEVTQEETYLVVDCNTKEEFNRVVLLSENREVIIGQLCLDKVKFRGKDLLDIWYKKEANKEINKLWIIDNGLTFEIKVIRLENNDFEKIQLK